MHIDASLYPCESLAGVVFEDHNEDVCQEATEIAVPNVTVELYGFSPTGQVLVKMLLQLLTVHMPLALMLALIMYVSPVFNLPDLYQLASS